MGVAEGRADGLDERARREGLGEQRDPRVEYAAAAEASAEWPDMKSTAVGPRAAATRSASSRPVIPGMITSVRMRWIGPACRVLTASATSGLSAASTS